MQESRVASRYAKSLLELAKERGVLEQVHNDMASFVRINNENPQLARVLKNPIIPHFKKAAILKSLLEGKFDSLSLAMFELVTKKGREGYLYSLAKEFQIQYRLLKGIQSAEVTTTFPLTEDQKSNFIAIVKKISGKDTIELKETVKPEIIGGYILSVGDRQIDQSVKSKINSLKNKFSDNPYISKY